MDFVSLTKNVMAVVTHRLCFSMLALPAIIVANGVMAADPPGFTGPNPSSAYSFDIEGCRLDTASEGTYAPPGTLTCDSSASWPTGGDAYSDGNLGKQWQELDLVPHRFGSDSSGAAGPETFQVIIGADNIVDDDPSDLAIGYDRIVNFVINEQFSTPGACELELIGENSFGDFGIGGAIEQVVQVLEITQQPNTVCVFDWVQRLAITSSNIPGSSNRTYIVAGTGAQSVPLPSDIQPQALSKVMSGVEDSLVKWSIQKKADPVNVDFANTCDLQTANTRDVTITIDYIRGAAESSGVTTTSTVQVTNPSSREVLYDCSDDLYGVKTGEQNESLLGTETRAETVSPGMTSFDIEHVVSEGARSLRNELSCALKVEDVLNPGTFLEVGTLDAQFSLPDDDIGDGEVVNQQVVISDSENITGDGFSFSTTDPSGTPGSFSGYTPGTVVPTETAGPVLWTSDPQSATGQIVFTKTVSVERFKDNLSGTLSDTATLPLTDAADVMASASTNFTAGALVDLTIEKTIPNILQGTETIDCNFTVTDSNGVAASGSPVVLYFTAGDTFKSTTLTGLAPDTYTVAEGSCGGLIPAGNSMQTVDLTLAGATSADACSATAAFINTIPGDGLAHAEVNKVTEPAGQENGWGMTLSGPDGLSVGLITADSDPVAYEVFADSGTGLELGLEEGSHTIVETVIPGWDKTAMSGDCSFIVDYPADFGKTFQCQFTNKQRGTIITRKVTDPAGGTGFGFSGDLPQFMLDDGQENTVSNLVAGNYAVTEADPRPDFDLVAIDCVDDFDNNGYNLFDSDDSNLAGRTAIAKLDPGETVVCTFTNRERGMVELLKLTNGNDDPNQIWQFTLNGPEVNVSDAVPPTTLTFDGAKLISGVTYSICEQAVPVAWSSNWEVEIDGVFTPIPGAASNALGSWGQAWISGVYDPSAGDPDTSNEDYCVDFQLSAAQLLKFRVDNVMPPGGDTRTIGYWKNWTTCDGKGRQAEKAAQRGGPEAGWYLLDDVLPKKVGDLTVDSCPVGVSILDKRDVSSGEKRAGDAAYGLAAQFLAARANLEAGAGSCTDANRAVYVGQILLLYLGFNGSGEYLTNSQGSAKLKAFVNHFAGELDDYNNGLLCP